MQRQSMMQFAGLIGLILVGLVLMGMTGCGVWPVMTEENGRRPHAMGKSDQVFLPWAPQPVHVSEEYGVSYRSALEGQIADPQSANSLEVVEGMSGAVGQLNLARYRLMFEKPPFAEGSGSTGFKGGGQ